LLECSTKRVGPFQSVGWAEPPRPAGACHRTGHKPDPLGRPDGRLRVPTLSSFTWALRDPSRSPQERAFAHSPVSATHRDLPRHRHLPRSIRMRGPPKFGGIRGEGVCYTVPGSGRASSAGTERDLDHRWSNAGRFSCVTAEPSG